MFYLIPIKSENIYGLNTKKITWTIEHFAVIKINQSNGKITKIVLKINKLEIDTSIAHCS